MQNLTICHCSRLFSSRHCYSEWLEVPSWWWSTQGDIWVFAIKTQVPHSPLKITFDKWGIQGRAVTCCRGALVSRRLCSTMKANWQSRLSKVVYVHFNPPTPHQITHVVFMETTFNTPSHGAVASLFHYVSTSEGQDAVFLPPSLTDTVVMSNDSCQGSEGASKWTDTGSVKTPRAKSTDNIIILRTLYRMMRPGESMWLMHSAVDVIPHILFKTVARRACCDCCHLERAAVAELRPTLMRFQLFQLYTEEIRAVQEVKWSVVQHPVQCQLHHLVKCQLFAAAEEASSVGSSLKNPLYTTCSAAN